MDVLDLIAVPPGTLLFSDQLASESISLVSTFSELTPSKFVMICRLDSQSPEDIKSLLQRLIGIIEIENIALLVGSPVSTYLPAIEAILDLGEFPIVVIYTTCSDISTVVLPQGLPRSIVKRIPHFRYEISNRFSIVPSLLRTLPLRLVSPSSISVAVLAEHVTSIFKELNETNPAFFAFGNLSESFLDLIDDAHSSESRTAVLLVDRTSASTPLFYPCQSLLDEAASRDLITTLRDKELIKAELSGTLIKKLCEILNVDSSSASPLEKCRAQLRVFSDKGKYPALSLVLNENNSLISDQERSLLEGGSILDIIERSSLELPAIIKLIGLANCLGKIDVDEVVNAGFAHCTGGQSEVRTLREITAILKGVSPGVTFGFDGKREMADYFVLPKLVRGIMDEKGVVDSRIKSARQSFLGKMFGGAKSGLRDFENVYIVVLGGISFFEMREIEGICGKSARRRVRLHVISETICSGIDLFGSARV
jgi:hypothetical protein